LKQDSNIEKIKISKIKNALDADVIVDIENSDQIVNSVYASDLMSDVLAYGKSGSALLTGLNTVQAVISAYMAEFKLIIFLRGKKPTEDIRKFAQDKEIIVFSTNEDMYEACVKVASVYDNKITSKDKTTDQKKKFNITTHQFDIDGKDFAHAGLVSTQIKAILKKIGFDPQLIRRVAISTYEGEMNVVMHAISAHITLTASDKEIIVLINDRGKGIPDIDRALQEGFSTATEEQRAMGFGSGMGLPNIKRNSDELNIESKVDFGTKLEIKFLV